MEDFSKIEVDIEGLLVDVIDSGIELSIKKGYISVGVYSFDFYNELSEAKKNIRKTLKPAIDIQIGTSFTSRKIPYNISIFSDMLNTLNEYMYIHKLEGAFLGHKVNGHYIIDYNYDSFISRIGNDDVIRTNCVFY